MNGFLINPLTDVVYYHIFCYVLRLQSFFILNIFIQVERMWDLVHDPGQHKLTYSAQNHCLLIIFNVDQLCGIHTIRQNRICKILKLVCRITDIKLMHRTLIRLFAIII